MDLVRIHGHIMDSESTRLDLPLCFNIWHINGSNESFVILDSYRISFVHLIKKDGITIDRFFLINLRCLMK